MIRGIVMSRDEILKGFEELGLSESESREYHGAELYGNQFKRCSILKDVQVQYSCSAQQDD